MVESDISLASTIEVIASKKIGVQELLFARTRMTDEGERESKKIGKAMLWTCFQEIPLLYCRCHSCFLLETQVSPCVYQQL